MNMSNRKLTLETIIFVGLSVFLVPGQVMAQKGSHQKAINTSYQDWVEAANAKNLDQWSSYLAPEVVFLPPNRPELPNQAAIREFYSQLFEDPRFHLECSQERVAIANSEDMAWSTGHCEATFTGSNGEEARERSKWAKVWIRLPNGEWKCSLSSWSSTGAR